jgi:imidazole glycerol-phosphate synthase subunit HisF
MLCKRIIPCLDIKDGRTVKGVNFVSLKDAGDPVELAVQYAAQGADELVFLDITATIEKRKTFASLVKQIASSINIPFTVGGGISNVNDLELLLKNGADKIAVNSAAIKNPAILKYMSEAAGSQCVVLAIDTKKEPDGKWCVYSNGGRQKTNLQTLDWAKQATDLGAGEILLTSMSNDGTKDGFALDITKMLADDLPIPVIASGGAGRMEDFKNVFQQGNADAALAASVFHYGEIQIAGLKQFLSKEKINVRL